MADLLKETEQDPFIAKLADFLGTYKGVANQILRHTESGYGLGNFLVGDAPELLTDMSYGSPPWRGRGYGTVVDPRLVDLLGMSVPGVGAAFALGKGIGKAAVKGGTQLGRREFLKKAGAGAAAAVVPGKMIAGLASDVASPRVVAKTVAKAAGTDWNAVRNAVMRHFDEYLPEEPWDSVGHALDAIKKHDAENIAIYEKSGRDPLSPYFSDSLERNKTFGPEDYQKHAQGMYDDSVRKWTDAREMYDDAVDEFITRMSDLGDEFAGEDPNFYVRMLTNDHFGYGRAGPYTNLGTDPRLRWYDDAGRQLYKDKPPFGDASQIPEGFVRNDAVGQWHHPDLEKWSNDYSYATPEAKAWLDQQDPYDVLKWWWTRKWPKDAPIEGFDGEYLAKTMANFPKDHPKAEVVRKIHEMMEDLTVRDPTSMGWETYMEGY